jgi:KaiC/GvpD/RAD55 family RecA-like ATPase
MTEPTLLMSRDAIRTELGLSPANVDRVMRLCRKRVQIAGSRSVYVERREVFRVLDLDDPRQENAA